MDQLTIIFIGVIVFALLALIFFIFMDRGTKQKHA